MNVAGEGGAAIDTELAINGTQVRVTDGGTFHPESGQASTERATGPSHTTLGRTFGSSERAEVQVWIETISWVCPAPGR